MLTLPCCVFYLYDGCHCSLSRTDHRCLLHFPSSTREVEREARRGLGLVVRFVLPVTDLRGVHDITNPCSVFVDALLHEGDVNRGVRHTQAKLSCLYVVIEGNK